MARDARLLRAASEGPGKVPILRLFQFRPAGVTLGRSQDAHLELDLARLEAAGIRWASRPTGGRAIWHEQEWTFSLVTPLAADAWAPDAASAYQRTCELLAGALRRLGAPVELSPGSPRGVGRPRAVQGAAPPCFATAARYELTLEGRKFAGIAQRQSRGMLLQQGSLLLGPSHLKLADWMRIPDAERGVVRAGLAAASCDAGPRLGSERSLADLSESIATCAGPLDRVAGEEGLALCGAGAAS